jgi:hypothetical protein
MLMRLDIYVWLDILWENVPIWAACNGIQGVTFSLLLPSFPSFFLPPFSLNVFPQQCMVAKLEVRGKIYDLVVESES